MSIYILSKTEKKLWGNPKNEKLIYNSIGLKLLHWGRLRQSILKYYYNAITSLMWMCDGKDEYGNVIMD
jgi:hypothetical protein